MPTPMQVFIAVAVLSIIAGVMLWRTERAQQLRLPLRLYIAFVVFCLFIAIFAVVASLNDGSDTLSVEQGRWAFTFRIIELLLLAIGSGSVLLLIEQLSLTARWNKRLTYHQFFAEVPLAEKLSAFLSLAKDEKIDSYEDYRPLSQDAARKLVNDPEKKLIVLAYLNDFEEFAAAVRRGLVDKEYAFDLESCRVIRAWTVFRPFVELLRQHVVYMHAYTEIQNLAEDWAKKVLPDLPKPNPPQA